MVPAAAVNDDGNDFCVNWVKTGIKYILYFVVTLCSFILSQSFRSVSPDLFTMQTFK